MSTKKNQAKNEKSIKVVGTSTEIAFPQTQDDVPKVIEKLKQLKENLLKGIPQNVSTEITVNVDTMNISHKKVSEIQTLGELVVIHMYLERFFNSQAESARILGIEGKVKPVLVNNKNLEEWVDILQKRAMEIVNKAQIAKLDEAIKDHEDLLDARQKQKALFEKAQEKANELIA